MKCNDSKLQNDFTMYSLLFNDRIYFFIYLYKKENIVKVHFVAVNFLVVGNNLKRDNRIKDQR